MGDNELYFKMTTLNSIMMLYDLCQSYKKLLMGICYRKWPEWPTHLSSLIRFFFCLFTEEMDNTEYMNSKCPGETVWKYTMIRAQLFKANDIVS